MMNGERMRARDPAVSPVVGVMLMLVVTIIIAAVVSAFAGGLSSDTEKAPQASISVRLLQDDGGMGPEHVEWKMVFEHLSGDSLQTRDLEIIAYSTLPDGTVTKHTQTKTSEKTDLYGYGTYTRVPLLNDMSLGYSGDNEAKDFGNYVWKTGDVLSSGSDAGTSALLGFDINDEDNKFGSGSVVDVRILHVPSGKYICAREVIAP